MEGRETLRLRLLVIEGCTEVIIDGAQGTLLDLFQGASVEVTYGPETIVITSIHILTNKTG